jgi:UDP-N-acetylglucosamine 4,6-dehydratase
MKHSTELAPIDRIATGRIKSILVHDIQKYEIQLQQEIIQSKFLVLGGAGSIGQAVVREIFKRNPKSIHILDISENNLVELTRDIRSSFGYIDGDFKTAVVDIGSEVFPYYIAKHGPFDYVLNFTAMKHVRSEKDMFSLARLIKSNIFNTIKSCELAIQHGAKKYFCVSTDKASNPVNLMGASKRIMELYLARYANKISISTARFANVAFSDGSLPTSFKNRLEKYQPLVAPNDIERYFVSHEEAGELCLLSCILGNSLEIFFPKLDPLLTKKRFDQIAVDFLKTKNLVPYLCKDEVDARLSMKAVDLTQSWPCLFTESDTTGEKSLEEFYTNDDVLNIEQFDGVGIINCKTDFDVNLLSWFENKYQEELNVVGLPKEEVVRDFMKLMPNFIHQEKSKSLEEKM